MDRALLELMATVLAGSFVQPARTRDALIACLELAPVDDGDANGLRLTLEDGGTLDELRSAIEEIYARTLANARGISPLRKRGC